jgi:plasmid stabilization system protein ParE
MSYSYILHDKAQEDYESAILWYEQGGQLTSDKFIAAVDRAFELICEHPTRWRKAGKRYRILSLNKYPYTIIYSIDEQNQLIVISAVHNDSKSPKSKYRK